MRIQPPKRLRETMKASTFKHHYLIKLRASNLCRQPQPESSRQPSPNQKSNVLLGAKEVVVAKNSK
jgi:hypothetical protein